MDIVRPVYAIGMVAVAYGSAFLLMRRFGAPPAQGRYVTIDGLRGYLGFFVFLHHGSIWYGFLRTGDWRPPPSNLFNQFGQGSVALFFMITGFLFLSRLLDGRAREIDWLRLFVSRALRLAPIYYFVMVLLFLIVAILSGFVFHEPRRLVLLEGAYWLSFTPLGAPNINGVENTPMILASVTWSLPYEWFFYLSLPLLSVVVRTETPRRYVLLSLAVTLAGWWIWHPRLQILSAFLGGFAAAFLVRSDRFRRFAAAWPASLLAAGLLAAAVASSPAAFRPATLALLAGAFILIACGNSFFGLFSGQVSRTLGLMTYSIYLLHGMFLFVTFRWVLGAERAVGLSPTGHWLVLMAVTPVLIGTSYAAYRWIEHPPMRQSYRVAAWLRAKSAGLFAARAQAG